jgi:hypothetical protein
LCNLEFITDLTARLQDCRAARHKAMIDKEKDKRLLLPRDEFDEEASEGLGRLNREEAEEDLRELKGRMERRVRKPRMIWLPAAAAVAVLLVASTVYITLFRDRSRPGNEVAMTATPITDTALIAMAQPIQKTGAASRSRTGMPETTEMSQKSDQAVVRYQTRDELAEAGAAHGMIADDKDKIATVPEAVQAEVEEEAVAEMVSEEVVVEEVVVEAMPGMEKAAAYEKMEKVAANDKKEKAPATKTAEDSAVAAPAKRTLEDSAAATPAPGAGMPDSQAAPVGGMEEFNGWIQSNIRYPEEVLPRARQVVVVSFKISADSTLYDLKAVQTPGVLFTNETLRLLRQGPRWEPAMRADKRVEEEVKISIVFK